MKKVKNRSKKYEVSIIQTSNGYFQARISVKIGCEKANRIQKGGTSDEEAIEHLMIEVYQYINQVYKDGKIKRRIDDIVANRLLISINNLYIRKTGIIQKVYDVINLINNINQTFNNAMPPYFPPNNILQPIQTNTNSETIEKNKQNEMKYVKYMIKDVAVMWKKYEIQLCEKTEENPRPLSHKTVDGYIKVLNNTILPFFENEKLMYISQIEVSNIKDLIKSVKCYDCKRNVHIVCVLLFRYLVNNNIIEDNPMKKVKKPVRPSKVKEEKIVCIEPENYNLYIEAFEKEETDLSVLYETMLYTGLRPEEACGLKWNAMRYDEKNNRYELIVQNASKKIAIYDDDMNIVSYKKQDGTLKTDDSYRCIPINSRLEKQLLKHKKNQKQKFKNSTKMKQRGKKWSENEYMFLGRCYTPYTSESLDKPLRKICDKYNLERFSPYALRRSFATWCFANGMSETTLTEIMGHSSFQTTHKFYVNITKKIKHTEMAKVFESEKSA